jgi:DNA-binding PadR family transcriptional regulator
MNLSTASQILNLATTGTYTTGEMITASGRSPSTVIRYLNQLQDRGLLIRRTAEHFGVGRPALISRPTEAGRAFLHNWTQALYRSLSRKSTILWGPRKAFSHYGVAFFGSSDIFAEEEVATEHLDLVVEPSPWLYEDAIEAPDGRYPCLEALAVWAARSSRPRYLGAAATFLRHSEIDAERLAATAKRAGATNRIGFLASVAGAKNVLDRVKPALPQETMLATAVPVDGETARLAEEWHIDRPVSLSFLREVLGLYGFGE